VRDADLLLARQVGNGAREFQNPVVGVRRQAHLGDGRLLALVVTPSEATFGGRANEQERAQVAALCQAVQEATGGSVKVGFVDQGYTGDEAAAAAKEQGIELEVVKLPEAKKGFMLLPKRGVVERSFAWAVRFPRLVRDYERLPKTLVGLHFAVFALLMLVKAAAQGLLLPHLTPSTS
jgi:transposase